LYYTYIKKRRDTCLLPSLKKDELCETGIEKLDEMLGGEYLQVVLSLL